VPIANVYICLPSYDKFIDKHSEKIIKPKYQRHSQDHKLWNIKKIFLLKCKKLTLLLLVCVIFFCVPLPFFCFRYPFIPNQGFDYLFVKTSFSQFPAIKVTLCGYTYVRSGKSIGKGVFDENVSQFLVLTPNH
jgi:hypothetical protein